MQRSADLEELGAPLIEKNKETAAIQPGKSERKHASWTVFWICYTPFLCLILWGLSTQEFRLATTTKDADFKETAQCPDTAPLRARAPHKSMSCVSTLVMTLIQYQMYGRI
jgi:hypothetical protein